MSANAYRIRYTLQSPLHLHQVPRPIPLPNIMKSSLAALLVGAMLSTQALGCANQVTFCGIIGETMCEYNSGRLVSALLCFKVILY